MNSNVFDLFDPAPITSFLPVLSFSYDKYGVHEAAALGWLHVLLTALSHRAQYTFRPSVEFVQA